MFLKLIKLPLTAFQFAGAVKKTIFSKEDKRSLYRALMWVYFNSEILRNRSNEVQIKLMGLRVHAFGYRSLYIFLNEIFIGNCYWFKSEEKNPYIIDCGANIGMAMLFFKKIYPDSIIDCFEPGKGACDMIRKNIEANGFTGVTIYNEAVSDTDGAITFYTHHDSADVIGSVRRDRGGDIATTVPCRSLSGFIGNKKVDLLKMDIEGAEFMVVDNLYQTKAFDFIQNCVMEYHHKIGNEPARMGPFLTKFENAGFDYNIATGFKREGQFQDVNIRFYKRK